MYSIRGQIKSLTPTTSPLYETLNRHFYTMISNNDIGVGSAESDEAKRVGRLQRR